MNIISKVSEITANDVAEYLNIYEVDTSELNTLNNLLEVAKAFVKGYTGLSDMDPYSDLVIVVLILVQDMYDNRTLYVDKGSLGFTVKTILDMHSVNLL